MPFALSEVENVVHKQSTETECTTLLQIMLMLAPSLLTGSLMTLALKGNFARFQIKKMCRVVAQETAAHQAPRLQWVMRPAGRPELVVARRADVLLLTQGATVSGCTLDMNMPWVPYIGRTCDACPTLLNHGCKSYICILYATPRQFLGYRHPERKQYGRILPTRAGKPAQRRLAVAGQQR